MSAQRHHLKSAPSKDVAKSLAGQDDAPDSETAPARQPRRGRPRNRRRKVPLSTSMDMDLLEQVEEYVIEHGITFVAFFEAASKRQLEQPYNQ